MPTIVTPAAAKRQVRDMQISDDDINALITRAEAHCTAFLDRDVYADSTALTAAQATAPTTFSDAIDALNARASTAEALDPGVVRDETFEAIYEARRAAQAAYRRTMAGMVTNGRFEAGVLLMVGHFYANAEAVIVDTGVQALELPLGVVNVLWPDRRLGV